jgi:hypothetical protein
MLDEQLQQFLALAQRFLSLSGLGNIANRARHLDRTPLIIELQTSQAVHPAHRFVRLANHPILLVKGLSRANDLVLEIGKHRRSIVGMDQGRPTLDGAVIFFVDSEDQFQDI